jgi:hypothetical protein
MILKQNQKLSYLYLLSTPGEPVPLCYPEDISGRINVILHGGDGRNMKDVECEIKLKIYFYRSFTHVVQ